MASTVTPRCPTCGALPAGICACCGGPIPPPNPKGGAPRRFCRESCRNRAASRRHAGQPEADAEFNDGRLTRRKVA